MLRYHIARNTRTTFAALAALAAIACGGGGDNGYGPAGGGGGGGGGGGPVGNVTVGTGIQFVSAHNGTMNPAVDTITAGQAMTWSWKGSLPHSIRSVGTPSFTSSDTKTGAGSYTVTFANAGTYHYDCVVHGSAMSGTVVVLPAATASRTAADATDDLFGSGDSRWDITALTVSRDETTLTVTLDFSRDILSPMSRDSAALFAVVDLDLDQNGATGRQSVVDEFRTDGGATGIRDEALLDLTRWADDSSIAVTDSLSQVLGRVKPVIEGKRLTVTIPRLLLGDPDGQLDAAAIVGNVANPTDFVPNTGHLTLGGAARAIARAAAVPAFTHGAAWGHVW